MSNPYYAAQPRAVAVGQMPGYGNPYALVPNYAGSSIIGAEGEKTFVDKAKDFLADDTTLGIKNGYALLIAAGVGAALYYGMK